MKLIDFFQPSIEVLLQIIKETQIVDNYKDMRLSASWISDNCWQLIGEDELIRKLDPIERGNRGLDLDDSLWVLSRIEYREEEMTLRLCEIYLPKERTGAGKRILTELIGLCKENNLSVFEVYSTNEKSEGLCKKFDMVPLESTKYYTRDNYIFDLRYYEEK